MIYWWSQLSLDGFSVGRDLVRLTKRTNRFRFRGHHPCTLLIQGLDAGMTVNGLFRLFGICIVGLFPTPPRIDFDQLEVELWTTQDPSGFVGEHWQLMNEVT